MADNRRETKAFFFLEPAITILVGLVLYFPLQRKDLAELTGIFGGLLVVANLAQTIRLRREFDTLAKLTEIMDLSQQTTVADIGELLRLYFTIKEPELAPLKDEAVDTCVSILAKLAYDKVSAELCGAEYYIWLDSMLSSTSQDARIRVVATMDEVLWAASPAQKKYLESNVRAAKHGTRLDRIFVTTRERLKDPARQRIIHTHIENGSVGIVAYIVWQEDLEKDDPELLRQIGFGFIVFGDRVALIDASIPPAEMRGFVTMSRGQIKSLHRIFDRLMQHAQIATPGLMKNATIAD